MSEQLQNDKGNCRIWHDTTKLIEHYGFFEGVAAWCLGMPINQVRPGNKPRPKLHELPLAKLRACGDQAVRVGEHQLRCSGFLDIVFVRLSRMRMQDVPYRSILSEKLENLLVADRCISATHVAASAARAWAIAPRRGTRLDLPLQCRQRNDACLAS